MQEIIQKYKKEDVKSKNQMFVEVARKEFDASIFKLQDIQLFFFPIFQNGHYYLICFNFGNDAMQVLDYNSDSTDYKKIPAQLVCFLPCILYY